MLGGDADDDSEHVIERDAAHDDGDKDSPVASRPARQEPGAVVV